MLIGIVGYERTGKDTVADYIVDNYYYEKIPMAEPIKQICKIVFGWNNSQLNNDKDTIDSKTNIKPRDMMKWIGTDIFQYMMYDKFPNINIDKKTIWTNYITNNCKNLNNTIIPDIRFLHEAEFIKKNNGILIYVDKIEKKEQYEILNILENYDYVTLDNHNTIHDLYKNIKQLMKNIK